MNLIGVYHDRLAHETGGARNNRPANGGTAREAAMGRWTSAALASALVLSATPGEAAWKSYINRELGFSFRAPGELKTEVGTYKGAVAGEHPTIIYRSADDDIEYKVTVTSFEGPVESASILGEQEFVFQDNMKVLNDSFGR